jgi:hypothetical protein
MAWGTPKTEHSGPKRGKGFWGRKAEAKQVSRRARRAQDRRISTGDHDDSAANQQSS